MNISLAGLTAVIGGSTQGIGLAIAEEFAEAGANCILLARNEERLKEVIKNLKSSATQQHDYRVADFSRTQQVGEAINSIVSKLPVHILVNNTGGPKPGPANLADPDQFLQAFQQHLVNNQLLVQAVLPGMKAASYGRVINIISTSVRIPIPNLGVSNTIRGAVASWAKTLSNELGQFQITVNNILPGLTDTERLKQLIRSNAEAKKVDVSVIEQEMMETIPAKRFALATEIANVAAFLASPAASYVNGISIPVDGGKTGSI